MEVGVRVGVLRRLQWIIWRRCHEKDWLLPGKAIGYDLSIWAFVCRSKGWALHWLSRICDGLRRIKTSFVSLS